MKELKKMNIGELKKLSRVEMKKIMAGSGHGCVTCGCMNAPCDVHKPPCCDGFNCFAGRCI
jgi:hypothetical protein